MNGPLQSLIKEPRGIWLDYIDYAQKLFSSANESFWLDSGLLISTYSQAQGLLQSDVIHLSVDQIYDAWIENHPENVELWNGKRPTFVLKKLLANEEPRNILIELISGLAQLNRGAKPFALSIGSPQIWLKKLGEITRPNDPQAISGDDIDSAAMYLSDFLRAFSTSGLSAIVIKEMNEPYVEIPNALELYQPVLNLAKHYGWSTGLSLPGSSEYWQGFDNLVDFTLFGEESMECILSLQKETVAVGGGLNESFWKRKQKYDGNSFPDGVLFGKIPAEANPETVLELLAEIRQLSMH